MSVCPYVRKSVSTQTSLSVLKLSGQNLPKSPISMAGIGQLYPTAPRKMIKKYFFKDVKKYIYTVF